VVPWDDHSIYDCHYIGLDDHFNDHFFLFGAVCISFGSFTKKEVQHVLSKMLPMI
jgi:hypothetical protein